MMMDMPDIRTLAAGAGLDRALALFPDEVARAVALVAAQRVVLRADDPPDRAQP
jgi:hypothetical protein